MVSMAIVFLLLISPCLSMEATTATNKKVIIDKPHHLDKNADEKLITAQQTFGQYPNNYDNYFRFSNDPFTMQQFYQGGGAGGSGGFGTGGGGGQSGYFGTAQGGQFPYQQMGQFGQQLGHQSGGQYGYQQQFGQGQYVPGQFGQYVPGGGQFSQQGQYYNPLLTGGQYMGQSVYPGGQSVYPGQYNPGLAGGDRNLGFVNQAFGNPIYNRGNPVVHVQGNRIDVSGGGRLPSGGPGGFTTNQQVGGAHYPGNNYGSGGYPGTYNHQQHQQMGFSGIYPGSSVGGFAAGHGGGSGGSTGGGSGGFGGRYPGGGYGQQDYNNRGRFGLKGDTPNRNEASQRIHRFTSSSSSN